MFVEAEKPRHNFARCWLRDMREQYLVMPNRDLTVLPWSSAKTAHAALVEEHEDLDPNFDWDEKRFK